MQGNAKFKTAIYVGCLGIAVLLLICLRSPSTPENEKKPEKDDMSAGSIRRDSVQYFIETQPARATRKKGGQEKDTPEEASTGSGDVSFTDLLRAITIPAEEKQGPGEKKYVSLSDFQRPYVFLMTEDDWERLSPEDQSTVIDEVAGVLKDHRKHVDTLIGRAKETDDTDEAEQLLLLCVESSQEFTANPDGLLISRIIGYHYQKKSLTELSTLYENSGDLRSVEEIQEDIRKIDEEVKRLQQEQIERNS